MGDFIGIIIWIAAIAAWFTHVINTIMAQEWLLLLAGAIAFPVGIIHGIGIWMGVW